MQRVRVPYSARMHIIVDLFQGYWTPPEDECDIPTLPSFDPKLLANAPPELLRGSRQSMVRICYDFSAKQ